MILLEEEQALEEVNIEVEVTTQHCQARVKDFGALSVNSFEK